MGLPTKLIGNHGRLRSEAGDDGHAPTAALNRFDERAEVTVVREKHHLVLGSDISIALTASSMSILVLALLPSQPGVSSGALTWGALSQIVAGCVFSGSS